MCDTKMRIRVGFSSRLLVVADVDDDVVIGKHVMFLINVEHGHQRLGYVAGRCPLGDLYFTAMGKEQSSEKHECNSNADEQGVKKSFQQSSWYYSLMILGSSSHKKPCRFCDCFLGNSRRAIFGKRKK
jgi:hypothetical protein